MSNGNTLTTLNALYQTYFDKKLLTNTQKKLELYQFGKKAALLPNSGATMIRFFRRTEADLSATGAPAPLAEGVTPTARRRVSYTPIDVTLEQHGQVSDTTDVAKHTGLLNFLKDTQELMSEECALYLDTKIRNALSDMTDGLQRRYAQGLANFTALKAATTDAARLTPKDIKDAVTQLKNNHAPKINGVYVAVVCPTVAADILSDPEWLSVIKQNYAKKYFDGEIGEIAGCRIVEATNPFVESSAAATEGVYVSPESGGNIYHTYVLGAEAFGVPDMKELGGSPAKPAVIINNQPDKSDPLNQLTVVGWKNYFAVKVLNRKFGQVIKSKATFVASA